VQLANKRSSTKKTRHVHSLVTIVPMATTMEMLVKTLIRRRGRRRRGRLRGATLESVPVYSLRGL
jgi:hypothetical protein